MFSAKRISFLLSFLLCWSCQSGTENAQSSTGPDLSMANLYAWCIVPFDSVQRTPVQRIAMLKDLGFQRYVYDWRDEHLPEMADEWRLARQNNIGILGVWMWIDENSDRPGQLGEANQQVLEAIEETGLETQIWLGFNANYFADLTDKEKVEKGVEMVRYVSARAEALGCRVALYNHGDWFGEPENQVRMIKALPDADVGIVYNFHHAHHQIDRFPEVVEAMKPYLWAVSLNGMQPDGPKILPIGKGEAEGRMLQTLHKAGFAGPYGILGHVAEADVEVILRRNLEGLQQLKSEDRISF